jgi:hypothetical protein
MGPTCWTVNSLVFTGIGMELLLFCVRITFPLSSSNYKYYFINIFQKTRVTIIFKLVNNILNVYFKPQSAIGAVAAVEIPVDVDGKCSFCVFQQRVGALARIAI